MPLVEIALAFRARRENRLGSALFGGLSDELYQLFQIMEQEVTDCDHMDNPKIKGLRMTRQRCVVYKVLMNHRDHPTAGEVYERAKFSMPGISLATVYNCLEALVQHGAVRQVNFERESSRYCPNVTEHGHFHDEESGTIIDVPLKEGAKLSDLLDLPDGAQVHNLEITLRGTIPN